MREKSQFDNNCKNIRELIYSVATRLPENNAFKIKVKGQIVPITFKQMIGHIEALGTELIEQGFDGSAMGIIGENSYPWYNCFLSIVCGGNVAVPFDKGFTPEELESSILRSNIRILFFDDKHQDIVDKVRANGKIQVEKFVCITGDDNEYEKMIAEGKKLISNGDSRYRASTIDENALAVLLFTSGTTNQSKAVMLSQYNITSNVIDMYNYETFYDDDVNIAFLPFHHSFGLVAVMVFLGMGACNVFCDGLKYVSKNLKEYEVSVFVGVPLLVESMYGKIMREIKKQNLTKKVELGLTACNILDKVGIHIRRKVFKQIIDQLGGHLRMIISGAAPLAGEVAKGMNDFGIIMLQGYGLTETSPVLAAESPENLRAGSVGKALPRVEIKIEDPDDDGIGEIVVKGPNVMLGYLNQQEETDAVLKDGWFRTGDLGILDKDGYLWIRGRSKNVIVMKNGKNIFPEEIESLINVLPYVEESLIFTRDKHNELVLWAKILYNEEYLKENGLTEEELQKIAEKDIEAINKRMPKYKQVNHFFLSTEPMIMTTTQKVKRNLEIDKILKALGDK